MTTYSKIKRRLEGLEELLKIVVLERAHPRYRELLRAFLGNKIKKMGSAVGSKANAARYVVIFIPPRSEQSAYPTITCEFAKIEQLVGHVTGLLRHLRGLEKDETVLIPFLEESANDLLRAELDRMDEADAAESPMVAKKIAAAKELAVLCNADTAGTLQ